MNSAQYINPLNDFFIRYLLASKGNEELCRRFINVVLKDADFPPVDKVTIKNPFNLKTEIGSKESVTDVKAETNDGKTIDIEVQVADKGNFVKRSLYYGTKMYSGGLAEGADYSSLTPVVVINLLNYVLWDEVEKPHSCFLFIDKADGQSVLTEDLVFHYIEAPKLDKYPDKLDEGLKTWLKYFKEEGTEGEDEMRVLTQNEPALQEAHRLYRRFTGSEEYREAYEAKKKWERDQLSALNYAERKGMKQGIKQGIEQGIEKGIEQGIEKDKHETAVKMLEDGLPDKTVVKYTGLSAEEVEKLKTERNR